MARSELLARSQSSWERDRKVPPQWRPQKGSAREKAGRAGRAVRPQRAPGRDRSSAALGPALVLAVGLRALSAQCFVQMQRCAKTCPPSILQPLQRRSLKVWLLCFIYPARLPSQFSFSTFRSFMNMEGAITCVGTTAFS